MPFSNFKNSEKLLGVWFGLHCHRSNIRSKGCNPLIPVRMMQAQTRRLLLRSRTSSATEQARNSILSLPQVLRAAAAGARNNHRWYAAATIPPQVQIVEVGPRDGLQNERQPVSVADKVRLIEMLVEGAGCTRLEPGSFVSPRAVPAMADTPAVMEALGPLRERQQQQLRLSCLVAPRLSYLEEALRYRPDEIAIFASASEAFSQKNLQCSIQESLDRFGEVVTECHHNNIPVRGYLSCVIACPYQGAVAPREVARVTEQLLDLGCHEISLGDTIGVGTPASTADMLDAALGAVGGDESKLAVHFHDT